MLGVLLETTLSLCECRVAPTDALGLGQQVRDILLRISNAPSILIFELFLFQSEIAFVGKAPGQYQMLLGGGFHGQRLSKIYRGVFLSVFFFGSNLAD